MLQNFRDWANTPFRGDQDVMHWVLFVGLLMVAFVGWSFVLRHLRGTV